MNLFLIKQSFKKKGKRLTYGKTAWGVKSVLFPTETDKKLLKKKQPFKPSGSGFKNKQQMKKYLLKNIF